MTNLDQHTSFIDWIVGANLPYLDAEAANREVVRLTVENLRLKAKLDAAKIKEGL